MAFYLLLFYLLPEESIAVGDVSGKLQRGKNTTSNVQLYSLRGQSLIADTPGFNRPNLKIEPFKLQFLFPEIKAESPFDIQLCPKLSSTRDLNTFIDLFDSFKITKESPIPTIAFLLDFDGNLKKS